MSAVGSVLQIHIVREAAARSRPAVCCFVLKDEKNIPNFYVEVLCGLSNEMVL